MICINGENFDKAEIKLSDCLEKMELSLHGIAVELNGKILPKAQLESAVFRDGDRVEIVRFMGGG